MIRTFELANVESLLQQHVDLLLLEGASLKASVASIEAANKANVPVVHFNILAEGGQYVTFVGSNQIESGIDMGREIVKLYKQAGKPKLKGIYMRGIAGYITDEITRASRTRLRRPASPTRSSGPSNMLTSRALRRSRWRS